MHSSKKYVTQFHLENVGKSPFLTAVEKHRNSGDLLLFQSFY